MRNILTKSGWGFRALIGLNLFLAITLMARLSMDPDLTPTVVTEVTDEEAEIVVAPESAPQLSKNDSTAFLQRPLFSSSRGGAVATAADRMAANPEAASISQQEPASPKLETVALAGVVRIGETRLALVRDTTAAETIPLKPGQEFRGWRLVKVEGESLQFANGEEDRDIRFSKNAVGGVRFSQDTED